MQTEVKPLKYLTKLKKNIDLIMVQKEKLGGHQCFYNSS